MNKLNKNRMIGGGVIVLAALLFAPAILTPEPHNLQNPTLTVRNDAIDSVPVVLSKAQPEKTATVASNQTKPAIQLESVPVMDNTAQPKTGRPVLISLESTKPVNTTAAIKMTSKPNTNESWLRLGSFASKKNANSLLQKIKAKYPAKIESITVNGKNYQRVLVGPFTDATKLAIAKKSLSTSGYKPNVQH